MGVSPPLRLAHRRMGYNQSGSVGDVPSDHDWWEKDARGAYRMRCQEGGSLKKAVQVCVLALGSLLLLGAGILRPAAALSAPKKALCAVCSVREGSGPEPVKVTATFEGKEYAFCTEKCRAEFLKSPQVFLKPTPPRPAPAFRLLDLSGKRVQLSDFKGKVVLVDFWATFCGPCIAAMPEMQRLHDKYAGQGFTVVGIATDTEPARVKEVPQIVARKKLRYPGLFANPDAWTDYEGTELPAVFLIDRGGPIVRRFGGKVEHKTIEEAVKALLASSGAKE